MGSDVMNVNGSVYNACRLKMAGKPFVKEAAMAKYFASQAAEQVTSTSLELSADTGTRRNTPSRNTTVMPKIGKICEGTSNMQLQTIAKLMLQD